MSNTNSPKKDKKFKYWGALSWVDSEPSDIIERAKKCNIECCCITHDKDFNEMATPVEYGETTLQPGEAKKTHKHWIFAFPNTTTKNNATTIIQEITNGNEPIGLSNVKGAFAYLTHKHDPNKYQYNTEDIQYFNGFVPENYMSLGAGEEDAATESVELIIDDQGFEEYADLMAYLRTNYPDLARFVRTHTWHINSYLKSKLNKRRQAKRDRLLDLQLEEYELRLVERKQKLGLIDNETGEVLSCNTESDD